MVWFHIPYSPVKSQFQEEVDALTAENQIRESGELFSEEDIAPLPTAVQRYLQNCGYIGTPKMSYLKMEYYDVDFMQSRSGPALKIDYTQYNFANEPCRMALIDSSMMGIPFEGCDYYKDGTGGMKGVIGKVFPLFHQTGPDMDQSGLVTFLAESMFIPSALLQDYITFEELGDYEVAAAITYDGVTAGGIFTFNEQYELISFTTNDRAVTGQDGTTEYVPWSALCGDYRMGENGIKYPTSFRAVWNYPDGDFVYFDGEIGSILSWPQPENDNKLH